MYSTVPIFLLLFPLAAAAEKFHEKLYGSVGAGNYTYYSLQQIGSVTIILHTSEGDADIYVSDKTNHPTFDLDNHVFQSVTCGLDVIHIPQGLDRPLSIAVYGHPSKDLSKYALEVIVDDTFIEEIDYFRYDGDVVKPYSAPKPNMPHVPSSSKKIADDIDNEEQSIIWTVLVGILKILIEVITS